MDLDRELGGVGEGIDSDKEMLHPKSDQEQLPIETKAYSDGMVIFIYVAFVFFILCIGGFCVWGGIRVNDEADCQEELDDIRVVKEKMKLRFVRESIELDTCVKFCNTTSCHSCCPACEGFPAPIPPPIGHQDNPGVEHNKECANRRYASLASGVPTSLCRFGPFSVHICGFCNDETISVLETPLSPTPMFGEGTVIASMPVDSLANGLLCKGRNAITGPDGTSRFTIRGDQTGYTIDFDVTITSTLPCPAIVCPAVM